MVMKRLLLVVCLLVAGNFTSNVSAEGVYSQELATLKAREDMKALFDKDMHGELRSIQQDIGICKDLSFSQRLMRGLFLSCDVIVVTPDSMPVLYAYVDTLCKKALVTTPTIFLTRRKIFFGAFAQKMFASTGGILIGQKLLRESSDEELEAVIAHEIGHIKHNHINQSLGLIAVNFSASALLTTYFTGITDPTDIRFWGLVLFAFRASGFLSRVMINKRFEKEADAFACEAGRAEGLIESFEHLQKKEQMREDEFIATEKLLKESWPHIAAISYLGLWLRYKEAKDNHKINKFWSNVYHNTPLGAHPSNEARIAAAQEYLAKQQQQA